MMRFVYVMDPMCAWCYGFEPELETFLTQYPQAHVEWIMGGLAPDSNVPMPDDLQQTISNYWHQIEASTTVAFNHDYWQVNTPYRSTYPACRAVIAAKSIASENTPKMVKAIQSAYYQQAMNPSLAQTLIECAKAIGLEESVFKKAFESEKTEQEFQQHLNLCRQLQVGGFPALFYISEENQAFPIALGYSDTERLNQNLKQVKTAIAQNNLD